MKSLADIIAFNTAHADEALKFGQTQLTASQAIDLNDPAQNAAYVADRDSGAPPTRAAIDTALTTNNARGDPDAVGHADRHSARAPATRRSSSPRATTPTTARPVGIAFNGTAYSEAKLLAFAYAYEQATKLRKTPSEINPAVVALLLRRTRARARPAVRSRPASRSTSRSRPRRSPTCRRG